MSLLEIILLFLISISLILAAIYYYSASNQIQKIDTYKEDPRLRTANFWLTLSYTLAWIGVMILVILIFIYYFANHRGDYVGKNYSAHPTPRSFSFVTIIVLLIISLSGFLTLNEINNSTRKDLIDKTNVPNHVRIAAIFSTIALVGLAIQFILSLFNKGDAKPTYDQEIDINTPIVQKQVIVTGKYPVAQVSEIY
jgi:NADH:ubiquinone oxidoreductase subunit 5 (subunit L)/multisubunit Na+/H+ antiporter MnhA subunit